MKLKTIQLCNFRQFYGQTPVIELAYDDKNITVIHGNNGSGKTTLLNGFTWILYDKFTAAFSSPESLINKRAIHEVKIGTYVECWGEIHFEHENKNYQVKRKFYTYLDPHQKIQSGASQLFMLIAGDDGRWHHPLQPPKDIIEQILPSSLHQYFFFDGERIDHIFRDGEKNNIGEDTKELLGVKVLDRGIDHLKNAKRILQDELKEIGDPQTKKLLKDHSHLETQLDIFTKKQTENKENLTVAEDEKKVISQRLLELSGIEELQKLKQQLERQEATLRHNLFQANRHLKHLISNQGYAIFTPHLIENFRGIVDKLREKGQLPSGIKQQFVKDLLDRQICICGTPLLDGNDPFQQVTNWVNKAGIANVEEATIRMETKVTELEKQGINFWLEVDKEQGNISQWRRELSTIENQLDNLKKKFRNSSNEELQTLQKRLDEVENKIRHLTLDQGANQQTITNYQQQIEKLEQIINKNKLKEEKQALAQKRINLTQEAIERIIEVRKRLEKQFRVSLEKKVQEIFASISFTPYIPRLNTEYELKLIENTSGIASNVAASTGENQILSLSFIGAIIDRVREWSQKNTLIGIDSSTFPVIMDSPFGSLDEVYRRQVAKSIPKIANQLVVLVTKTQWRGEVETEMKDYIGKEYILVYHSPKKDCKEDFISLKEVNYPLVKLSENQFEYTEIIEIN
jgi:DNA sulfur modification protein DndD